MASSLRDTPIHIDIVTSRQKGKTRDKRKREVSCDIELDTNTESMSYSVYEISDSDFSVESEFEHDYCTQKKFKGNSSKTRLSRNGPTSTKITWRDNEVDLKRRSKCNTKNAVIARMNTLKKKKYIENLEARSSQLEAENKLLNDLLDKKMNEINSLKREKVNLRNVIRHSSEIGSLLKCIHVNTNLQISSSLLKDVTSDSHVNLRESQPSSIHSNIENSPANNEAFVAANPLGLALHSFCQS